MEDDHTPAEDRGRIELCRFHEVAFWTDAPGVGEAPLREAVEAVGPAVGEVRKYLNSGV